MTHPQADTDADPSEVAARALDGATVEIEFANCVRSDALRPRLREALSRLVPKLAAECPRAPQSRKPREEGRYSLGLLSPITVQAVEYVWGEGSDKARSRVLQLQKLLTLASAPTQLDTQHSRLNAGLVNLQALYLRKRTGALAEWHLLRCLILLEACIAQTDAFEPQSAFIPYVSRLVVQIETERRRDSYRTELVARLAREMLRLDDRRAVSLQSRIAEYRLYNAFRRELSLGECGVLLEAAVQAEKLARASAPRPTFVYRATPDGAPTTRHPIASVQASRPPRPLLRLR